jgi:hypothetical protein
LIPSSLDRPEICQGPASCGKVLEQSAVAFVLIPVTSRAAVVGGFSAGGLRRAAG